MGGFTYLSILYFSKMQESSPFSFSAYFICHLDLQLCFFMDLLLGGGYIIQLGAHILNLLGLGCLDVCLSLNILVALLDLFLGALISFIEFSLRVLGLCKLYLNVSE